eukprot:3332621-Rhodomonas_salina.3
MMRPRSSCHLCHICPQMRCPRAFSSTPQVRAPGGDFLLSTHPFHRPVVIVSRPLASGLASWEADRHTRSPRWRSACMAIAHRISGALTCTAGTRSMTA